MKWNNKGFTLTEMLVVLSISLIIISFSLIQLKQNHESIEKNLFLSQFKSDIFFAQQYAISHQTIVTVNIMSEKGFYYFRERLNGPIIFERHYSEEIKVTEASMPLYFQFSPSGTINRFGSFFMRIGAQTYRITFYIGKGRIYVKKE